MGHAVSIRLGASVAFLVLLERVSFLLAAYNFVARGGGGAFAYGTLATVALASRSLLSSFNRAYTRRRLHELAVEAVLRGDVMGAALPNEDAQVAVFDGIHYGTRVLAEIGPALVGDAVAGPILAVFLVLALPAHLILVGGTALALAALAMLLARRTSLRIVQDARHAYTPVVDGLVASLAARLEIVASGRDDDFRSTFATAIERWERVSLRSEAITGLAGRLPVVAAAAVIAFAIIAEGSFHGAPAFGEAATFASVVPVFLGLTRGAQELVTSRARIAPFRELLARRLPMPERATAPSPTLPASIAWENVTFAYPRADGSRYAPAVECTSIVWRSGEVLVLTGSNGSGKSTLLRLLLGLAVPSVGRICVGGTDLRELDLHEWRRRVAFLPQRPHLPERGTIRDAMHLLVPEADDAAIEASLERVEVMPALRRSGATSPLDTLVSSLSVGERQRVALARLLARDSEVVLLDEPDANLDANGIALVGRLVRELARGRMVAIAAHTAALVDAADHLVTLGARESATRSGQVASSDR